VLCGFTVGEYIRSRRLTLAAQELSATDIKVIDTAVKYGYYSPDSFARAFILITNKTIDKKSSHNPYTQDYAQFFV